MNCTFSFANYFVLEPEVSAYEKLLEEIFEHYDPKVFPALHAGDLPVTIYLDLAIAEIIDLVRGSAKKKNPVRTRDFFF